MASTKRAYHDSSFPDPKRAKGDASGFSERKVRVALNPADCNLDFNIDGGLHGYALHDDGFAYCWSGARANVGISGGRYCFGCKIISYQPVIMEDTPLDQQHISRVGISRGDDSVGNLGETEHSYGFGGTGKFSSSGKYSDYGRKYGLGDTIVCAVDLESKASASIGFSKNGEWLGVARKFNAGLGGLELIKSSVIERPWGRTIFPHVLLKNVEVQMQFSLEDGLVPVEGYKPWACAMEDGNAVIGPAFSDPQDCEVIMMVGLPASGKTTWAEKWIKEHPEKRYICLGTNLALDQMKVPGLLRRNNYGERFERLMDRATKIFNTLLSRAAKTPRNYILDQTNVYKSARKRKLKPFAMYIKIAVVVFPKPEDLDLRSKNRAREMGKEVPIEAFNEMIANFVLPMSKDMPATDEYFDAVMFPELSRDEAQKCLDEMKRCLTSPTKNLRNAGPSSVQQHSAQLGPSVSHQFSRGRERNIFHSHLAEESHQWPMPGYHMDMLHHQQSYRCQYPPHVPPQNRGFEQPGRPEALSGFHQWSINPSAGYHRHSPLTPLYAESQANSYRGNVGRYQSHWTDGTHGEYVANRTDAPRNPHLYGRDGAYMIDNVGSRANLHLMEQDFRQMPSPEPYGSRYGIQTPESFGRFPRSTRPFDSHPLRR